MSLGLHESGLLSNLYFQLTASLRTVTVTVSIFEWQLSLRVWLAVTERFGLRRPARARPGRRSGDAGAP